MVASWKADSFALVVTFAQLGQIIPQHFELASERSVVGVSPWLLFFAALYTQLAAIDLMISSSELFYCTDGAYRCFIDSQPLVQMIGSALLSAGLWYWYLKYADGDGTDIEQARAYISVGDLDTARGRGDLGRFFFELYVCFAVLSSLAAVCVVGYFGTASRTARLFSVSCGMSSAVLNAIMWLPQIYVTWKYKHKGALSVLWVLASIVMDVVYSVYLSNLGVNFSVWANNIPDGIQTGILLALVLYFEYQDEKAGKDNFGHRMQRSEDKQRELDGLIEKLSHEKSSQYGSLTISVDSNSNSESDIDGEGATT